MARDKAYTATLFLKNSIPYQLRKNNIVYYYDDSGVPDGSALYDKYKTALNAAAVLARVKLVRMRDMALTDGQKRYLAPWLSKDDEQWQLRDDFFKQYRVSDSRLGPILMGFPLENDIYDNGSRWHVALMLELDEAEGSPAIFKKAYNFCKLLKTQEAEQIVYDHAEPQPKPWFSGIEFSIGPRFAGKKRVSEDEQENEEKQISESAQYVSADECAAQNIDKSNDEATSMAAEPAVDYLTRTDHAAESTDNEQDNIRFSVSDDNYKPDAKTSEKIAMSMRGEMHHSPMPPRQRAAQNAITYADQKFDYDTLVLIDEIRNRILKITSSTHLAMSAIMEIIGNLPTELSNISVDNDGNISFPLYGMTLDLAPMPRAVYILFLKHPEGIRFKDLSDHQAELENIYAHIRQSSLNGEEKKKIALIVDPTHNSINVQCSRIKLAVLNVMDIGIGQHYYISGNRGEAKAIAAASQVNVTLPQWV